MPDTASHASTRRQARTDGGGGEKESSVQELCSLESVCGQACVYRHIARCVFTIIFINHKYSCSGVFNFKLQSCQQMKFGQSIGLWEGSTAKRNGEFARIQPKTFLGSKGPQYTGNVGKKST